MCSTTYTHSTWRHTGGSASLASIRSTLLPGERQCMARPWSGYSTVLLTATPRRISRLGERLFRRTSKAHLVPSLWALVNFMCLVVEQKSRSSRDPGRAQVA